MSTIELRLDETNELLFGVEIQGAKSQKSVFRIVCEGRQGLELMFQGAPTPEGEVLFQIPPLQEFIDPGQTNLHLEVIVDNKLFVPMNLTAEFDYSTKVVAESVKVINQTDKSALTTAKLIRVGTQPTLESVSIEQTATDSKELTLRELYDKRRSAKQARLERLSRAAKKVK